MVILDHDSRVGSAEAVGPNLSGKVENLYTIINYQDEVLLDRDDARGGLEGATAPA